MNFNSRAYVNQYLRNFQEILNNMSNEMLSYQCTGNITIDFIECMIPHHQAAIYMSQNLLKYTTYQPLIKIANDIIKMQEKGIKQMKDIAVTTPNFKNLPNEVNEYFSKYTSITKNMIYKMQNAPRSMNINWNFVNEMIPHHEGAVEMCNNVLQYKIDYRLVEVAKNIIKEQTQGIKQLEEVKNKLC